MGLGIVAAGLGGDEAATVGRLCLLLARDALHPVPCTLPGTSGSSG